MPELPEVETICRGLKPALEGQTILDVALHRPNLRYPFPEDFVETLKSQRIKFVTRRSKYVLIELASGVCVVIHLGMSGRIKIIPGGTDYMPVKHDHVIISLGSGAKIVYHDPRRFGFMDTFIIDTPPVYLVRLGVEPLGNEFNGSYLAQKWAGKSVSMKTALLDQRIVAGLGNIYVLEALFRTGISPFISAGDLVRANGTPTVKLENLVITIKDVLQEAIKSGGSTLKDYQQSDGSLGYFQHHFQVYGREGETCFKSSCSGYIQRKAQNGRSTFFCPKCQK